MAKRRDGNRRATDRSTLLAILAWRGYDAVGTLRLPQFVTGMTECCLLRPLPILLPL